MLLLLRADLTALGNVLLRRAGRKGATATVVSLAVLLAVSWLFGTVLAMTPEIAALRDDLDPARARAAAGTLLMPAMILTLWFAFGGGARQLFEAPTLTLWWTAPLSARAVTIALWLRFSTLIAVWCLALVAPALHALADGLGIRFGWPALIGAALCLTLPTVALVFAAQIIIQRCLAGRYARLVLSAITTLGSLAFSAVLILGGLAQRDAALQVVRAIRGRAVFPWLVEAPARVLAADAQGGVGPETIALAGLAPLAAAGLLLLLAPVHRRAWEISREAPEPLRRTTARRPWPARAAAAVFRKELAQLLHQPGQLLGILFSTLIVVVLGASRFIGDRVGAVGGLPPGARNGFMLLGLWLFAQLTVAPGCMVRLVVTDGRQWELYRAAPVSTAALLLGKLRATALLQTWPAAVAVLVGVAELGATRRDLLLFAAVVPAGILWTTALTALVGTIPPLMRPRQDRNHLTVLVGVALLLFGLQLSVIPGLQAWWLLAAWQHGQGPLRALDLGTATAALIGGAWLLFALLAGAAFAIARLQLARLRAPER